MSSVKTKPNQKPKGLTFFLLAFVILGIVFVLTTLRSHLKMEVPFPHNNGFSRIAAVGDVLYLVSQDAKLYRLDWTRLDEPIQPESILSEQAVILNDGRVINLRQNGTLHLTEYSPDGDSREYSWDRTAEYYHLVSSADGQTAVIYLNNRKSRGEDTVYLLDTETLIPDSLTDFYQDHPDGPFDIRGCRLSPKGHYLAVFGRQGQQAWLAVYDLADRRMLWQMQYPDLAVVRMAAFSMDEQTVFFRDGFSCLHHANIQTGRLSTSWLAREGNPDTRHATSLQDIDVSADGDFLAAFVQSSVVVWNLRTGRQRTVFSPGHKIETGLCFSPDGRLLATADLRQGGPVKIWKVPRTD